MVRVGCYRGSAKQERRSTSAGVACKGVAAAWLAGMAGEARRAARALSSGCPSFRATGVTSEEHNRKLEVLRLITCAKQRNPLHSRSQSKAQPIVYPASKAVAEAVQT